MKWSEEDNWSLEVDLFPGVTDFKCAVVRQDGSVASWEPGANRTVEVRTHAMATITRPCLFYFTDMDLPNNGWPVGSYMHLAKTLILTGRSE